jgi:hypothetical protein
MHKHLISKKPIALRVVPARLASGHYMLSLAVGIAIAILAAF